MPRAGYAWAGESCQPYLEEWSARVRDAHGWGIFIAKAEDDYWSGQ
jgi:hypothetical protein